MPRIKEEYTKPADTIISEGFIIRAAQLSGKDSVRIDGGVYGAIELEGGYVQLGNTGYVEGDIYATSAVVAGRVNGSIRCRAAVHLASTAVITGNITTSQIIIDEGAIFHGYCKTDKSQQ
ncbi:MAG: polymer-forming cytoskeletal protein [Defluviitaleaceae bacterium]|nr:polymer-forming cytoskeletal protein [Defluviitaleaceae bacterium]